MKTCTKCKVTQPIDAFRKDGRSATGLHSWCKLCFCRKEKARYRANRERIKARMREQYHKNPEKMKELERQRYLLRKTAHRAYKLTKVFGMSVADYDRISEEQNHVCAICGQSETLMRRGVLQRLSIDHSHESGKVRGLLCANCNSGLGLFQDNSGVLMSAALYLQLRSPNDDIV